MDNTTTTPLVNNVLDPRILHAHMERPRKTSPTKSKYNDDNPSYDMAMRGPFQSEFYHAMREELHTLQNIFNCWTLVTRTPDMRVLPSTWTFKIKRYPDGTTKKFKARFCVYGNKQVEGIDFDDTFAPVVQWSTIRTMMILAIKLGWVSAQCDITAAFLHATIPENEYIYVHQPRGFHTKDNHVLRLRRSLYGLRQAPRSFFTFLSKRLIRQGLRQSPLDPCLFIQKDLIVIVYIDDLLVYSKTTAAFDSFLHNMQNEDIALRREGTAEGYLGVDIATDGNRITLTQTGLAKRVVTALGLDDKYSRSSPTPAECAPLPKDIDGEPPSGMINYASVVGMLLYLSGHS